MPRKSPSLAKNVKTLLKEGDKLLKCQDLAIEEIQGFLDKRDVLLGAFQELPEDEDTHDFKLQLRQLFLQGEDLLTKLLKASDELAESINEVSRQKQVLEKYKFPIVDTEQYTFMYANNESNGSPSPDDTTQPSTEFRACPDGEIRHTDRHC